MRVVIFANGEMTDLDRIRPDLQLGDHIIAADGGTRHALAVGRRPEVVIGDLDSFTIALRQDLEAQGTQFWVYPARKEATDLELALEYAASLAGVEEIIVYSALGGRWDQTLANVLLLSLPALAGIPTRLRDGRQSIWLATGQTTIQGQPGDIVSLIPAGGPAVGIKTEGLEYPLCGETLGWGTSRGVSNVLLGSQAEIWIEQGALLVIRIAQE